MPAMMPGHGTVPAGLTAADMDGRQAATRLAGPGRDPDPDPVLSPVP